MSTLRLMDLYVGRNEETTNYDSKHLAKRFRTFIIGGNFKIGDIIINRTELEKILALAPNNSDISIKQLLDVNDKQKIDLAVQFLLLFCLAVEDFEKLKTVSFKTASVAAELNLMSSIIKGVLCTFRDTSMCIKDQRQKLSLSAHILMIMQRELSSFIPNQLYHDLQSTFEDAFFCAAKWKIYHPDKPLFLMLCSNDVLERFFGILRQKYRNNMIDNMEIILSTRAIELCGR